MFHNKYLNQKAFASIYILIGILVIVGIVGGGYYFSKSKNIEQKACTLEARICPDGSSVGRIGPNCEFSACPAQNSNPSKYDALVTKVKSEGVIRIIVTFDVQTNNEQLIAKAQEKILNDLSPYNVSSVTKFKYTPAIGFEVNKEALNFLISSPSITNIQEDSASAPTN